jgi:hypothetical protein
MNDVTLVQTSAESIAAELHAENQRLREQNETLAADLAATRLQQLDNWAQYVVVAELEDVAAGLRAELDATRVLVTEIRRTKSWKLTKPLRMVRSGFRRDA